jgi:hypothetical protein
LIPQEVTVDYMEVAARLLLFRQEELLVMALKVLLESFGVTVDRTHQLMSEMYNVN